MAVARPPESTFNVAAPYAVTSLTIGVVGAIGCVAATAVAAKVIFISMAVIGSSGFLAILICGFINRNNPAQFRAQVGEYISTIVGSTVARIIHQVAIATITELLNKAFNRNSSHHSDGI
jgi:NhaP-type Na+/H+ and K+/H+ antiporter